MASRRASTPKKPARAEEDVEEVASAQKEKAGGLHYTTNQIKKAYERGYFFSVNRNSKSSGARVGTTIVKQLEKDYYAMQFDYDTIETSKKVDTKSLSDNMVNYLQETGMSVADLRGNKKNWQEYISRRIYVYDPPEAGMNLAGPAEDVAYVLMDSGSESDDDTNRLLERGYHFGNIGLRDASDFYSEVMGAARASDAELNEERLQVEAVEDDYNGARDQYDRTNDSTKKDKYDLEDLLKVYAVLRNKSADEKRGKKPALSPHGRIGRKIPVLTKLDKLSDGKVLKIQGFADGKAATSTEPPKAKTKFVLINDGTIMVEHKADLQALIAVIQKESKEGGVAWDASKGKTWLAEFDEAIRTKKRPELTRLVRKPAARVVARSPRSKSPAAARPAVPRKNTPKKVVPPKMESPSPSRSPTRSSSPSRPKLSSAGSKFASGSAATSAKSSSSSRKSEY